MKATSNRVRTTTCENTFCQQYCIGTRIGLRYKSCRARPTKSFSVAYLFMDFRLRGSLAFTRILTHVINAKAPSGLRTM